MVNTAQETLKKLLEEVEGMDASMFVPQGKKEKGEKVLGTVEDPMLRKLYSLSQLYRRDEHMAKAEIRFVNDDDSRAELKYKAYSAQEKADILTNLFWYLTMVQINHFEGSIGVRSDWTVVVCNHRHDNPLLGLIQQLGGDE